MGKFFADLDQTVPAGELFENVVPYIVEVTERHGVTISRPAVPEVATSSA